MAEVFITKAEGFVGNVPDTLRRAHPLELSCRSEAIAPAGCPIMSACLIVDKMKAAISDGENKWYMRDDGGNVKFVEAGQEFSGLF